MAGRVAFTAPTFHGCQSGRAFWHDLQRCVCGCCGHAACGTCARRFGDVVSPGRVYTCGPCGSPATRSRARHGDRSRVDDHRADVHDRALGRSIASWARRPDGSLPNALQSKSRRDLAKHNPELVRVRAYQEQRDAGLHGAALDESLDLIDYAVKTMR